MGTKKSQECSWNDLERCMSVCFICTKLSIFDTLTYPSLKLQSTNAENEGIFGIPFVCLCVCVCACVL